MEKKIHNRTCDFLSKKKKTKRGIADDGNKKTRFARLSLALD
jgi:hypothetical protein